MTAFGLTSIAYVTPNRLWLANDHGTEIMPGYALDLSLFNAAQHYPNGFLPDGVVLGVVTATGKVGPYLSSASDGRQTAVGISFNPFSVYQPGTMTGALVANVGMATLVHGFVYPSKLPFNSTNQALGGYLDTAAQTALKNVIFVNNVA